MLQTTSQKVFQPPKPCQPQSEKVFGALGNLYEFMAI